MGKVKLFLLFLLLGGAALFFAPKFAKTINAQNYNFPTYTVTNIIIVPQDVEMDPEYPRLVSEAVRRVQGRYAEILGGPTFQINNLNNGDVIVYKSNKKLKDFCNPDVCRSLSIEELGNAGFSINRPEVILNTFILGVNFRAGAYGPGRGYEDQQGVVFNDNSVLISLKEKADRASEILCQTYLGRSCKSEYGLYVIAHELGHAFGLSSMSRWAQGHSCSTANTADEKFCTSDLDKKFYPGSEESNNSIMGYGINAFRENITFNDSCVNPEKTILKSSRFFGGNGFKDLNFENCLKLPTVELKIASLDRDSASPGDELTIHTEGLLPSDSEIQVIFPPDNPARSIERVDNNTLKAIIPDNAVSGEILVSVLRNRQQIRSNPARLRVISTSPIINKIEPSSVKPGDIITLTGENLIPQGQESLSAPVVRFGGISQEEIIESSSKQIKLRVPENTSLGEIPVYIILKVFNPTSKEFKTLYSSNSVTLTILPAGGLTAVIEGPSEIKVGETADFKAYVTEVNTIPQAAEILIRGFKETPCSSELLQDGWCKISKDNFLQSGIPGRARTLVGQYVPTKTGTYEAVINAYGSKNTKCSGNFGRPSDWIDCGERSRLTFRVIEKEQPPETPGPISEEQGSINAAYHIENKSDKLIKVTPKLCKKIKGILTCNGEGGKSILPGDTFSDQYSFTNGPGGSIKQGGQYAIGCWIDEFDANGNYIKIVGECPIKTVFAGDNTILNFNIQVTNKGVEQGTSIIAPPSATPTAAPTCSLTASANTVKMGEYIKWGIKNSPSGATAYWRGSNNGISIIPTDVEGYSNTTFWSQEYKYAIPGYYERFVGIQDKEGKTVCTTDKVSINVGAETEQVFLPTIQRSEPVNTALPIGGGQPVPNQTAQNLQKSVVGILVNGARMNFANKVSIHLPETVVRGVTHPIPITVTYGGEGSVRENSRSQILVFRYVVPGSENSGEKFSQGQACDPAKYSCFVMAEQENGSPERLFCRNMGDGYKWVMQKHAYDLCQGKEGITSVCKNKEGNETTYYCTGQDWVDKDGWAVHQEKVKKAQEVLKPHEVLPSGKIAEDIKEIQKRLEEESKGLSCSLEARPPRIKVGEEKIAWTIETQNFTGVSAEWHGTDNGLEFAGTVPVHEFPKPNSPNSWTESYPYQKGGIYTRYALIKDSEGRTCQTNALGVVIEDSDIARGILPKVGEIPSSIANYVSQIEPKTVKQILLLLPPYGQRREANPGDKIQFSLPDTGGVPQTIQLPITIIYSDGSTGNKTISFAYKGNTCGLSGGRCADSNGDTQDNYHCDEFRTDLSGCSLDKDRAHPYCYTKCSPKSTAPSGSTQTQPQTQTTPTQTQNLNCVANKGVCTDSGGNTKDGTLKNCKNYWDLYSKAAGGCIDGDYIWCYEKTSCTPGTVQQPAQETQTPPQTSTQTATCNGSGEYCADSEGNPKDPNIKCNTSNKAYRNDSAKNQWCQQGTPGWYCWLCQQ